MLTWTLLKFIKNVKKEVVDWERFKVIIKESYEISSAAHHTLRTFLVVIAVDLVLW